MNQKYNTIISASELGNALNKRSTELGEGSLPQSILLLDCRHDLNDPESGFNAYKIGHIQGAYFAHLDQHLAGGKYAPDGSFLGRHPLPDLSKLVEQLQAWGLTQETQVVTYDAHGGMFAARAWWLLRRLGHSAVAVLDGGLPAWLALNLSTPLEQASPTANRGDFIAQASLVETVSVDDIQANLLSGKLNIVDARSPDRYRGENETLDPVGGHIPGAKNRFFKDNLQADGRFKSVADLQAEWRAIVSNPSLAVMQCGSGVTACHNLLALEIAGLTGAALYPGSWSQWCADPSRPIAK